MGIDLDRLKENDLKKYSYDETLKVVDELERTSISKYAGIVAIEKSEMYYAFALLIKNRIENDEFIELRFKNKKNDKELLQHRLITMLTSFKYSLDLGKLEKRIKEVETFDEKIKSLNEKLSNIQSDYDKKKADIEKSVADFEKRINDSEHTILAHVLALIGIFSAIMTIIMSVVMTSSSWLNNADSPSAIIAFIIPNLVALIAVFVLLSLIFFYLHHETSEKNEKCAKHKRSLAFTICIVALVLCVILGCWICLSERDKAVTPHAKYILSPGEYSIKEDETNPADNTDEPTLYFEFDFEDKHYSIEYNQNLLHDGNLYFCAEHEVLE